MRKKFTSVETVLELEFCRSIRMSFLGDYHEEFRAIRGDCQVSAKNVERSS